MIGIIPAGGKASRMMGIPKMLLPTPQGTLIHVLRERMRVCHPNVIAIAATPATHPWLEGLQDVDTTVYAEQTGTISGDILSVRGQFADEVTLFGMADTYFEDERAFEKLATALDDAADVTVGVFETCPEQRHKLGMCQLQGTSLIHVVDKPQATNLIYAWGVIAWKSVFWQHIHAQDATIGVALSRAIHTRLDVRAVRMRGSYYDCGTPDEYFKLIREVTDVSHAAI